MYVDYKISRIIEDFKISVLVRFYHGDFVIEEEKKKYKRMKKVSEKTYIFDFGTPLSAIRIYLNKSLSRFSHPPIDDQKYVG